MRDRFQPLAVIQKLDEMRSQLAHCKTPLDHLSAEQWNSTVDGMRMALVWARVEIMAMGYDPDRFSE